MVSGWGAGALALTLMNPCLFSNWGNFPTDPTVVMVLSPMQVNERGKCGSQALNPFPPRHAHANSASRAGSQLNQQHPIRTQDIPAHENSVKMAAHSSQGPHSSAPGLVTWRNVWESRAWKAGAGRLALAHNTREYQAETTMPWQTQREKNAQTLALRAYPQLLCPPTPLQINSFSNSTTATVEEQWTCNPQTR